MPRPKKKASVRRVWYGPDKLRLAYLAGQGMTASQIADAMGGTTGPRVRSLLAKVGLQLLGTAGRQVVQVKVRSADANALAAQAVKRDREPEELAALVISAAVKDPDLIDSLVDENDAL